MRKEYGNALRKLFSAQMKQVLPRFKEVKVKSVYCAPGERAYRWIVSEPTHCWIVLSPDLKGYDRFHVLIGWSKRARYPEVSMIPCAEQPTPDHAEFAYDEYLIRLPSLWTTIDTPWVVREFRVLTSAEDLQASMVPISPEQALNDVTPLVNDAISRLQTQGLSYLETFAGSCGVEAKTQ